MKRRNFLIISGFSAAGTTFSVAVPEVPRYEPAAKISGKLEIFTDRDIASEVTILADAFNKIHPEIKVLVEGSMVGGNLADGPRTVQNPLYFMGGKAGDDELVKLGVDSDKVLGLPIFSWGVFIVVNEKNPIKSIDFESLKNIFFGDDMEYPTWLDLGAVPNSPKDKEHVTLHGMSDLSRFTRLFQKIILTKHKLAPKVQKHSGAQDLLQSVARSDDAIGFCGRVSKETRALGIRKKYQLTAVEPPISKSISSDGYPLMSVSMLYSQDFRRNIAHAEFCRFLLSKEGIQTLEKLDFTMPLADEECIAARHKLERHLD